MVGRTNCSYGSSIPQGRLPQGYTEVNYIQSTGTQYIDTGIKPNGDTTVIADVEFSSTSNDDFYLFGEFEYPKRFCSALWESKHNVVYGAINTKSSISAISNTRHIVKLQKNMFYVDDVLGYTATKSTFQSTYNLYLFALNNGTPMLPHKGNRAFRYTIYDGDTLARDFIPCIRDLDQVAGMYDLVTDTFYGNSGTGTFLYG